MKKQQIILIAAVSNNRTIGDGNDLLWHLPKDLKFFKQTTLGHPIVMGRKTFQSIGSRPLPKRRNIVLTSNPANFSNQKVDFFSSKEELLEELKDSEKIFITGGSKIYELFLPEATTLILTKVDTDIHGDVKFPKVDFSKWKLVSEEFHLKDENNKFNITFTKYLAPS